jgi:hypothetical protein
MVSPLTAMTAISLFVPQKKHAIGKMVYEFGKPSAGSGIFQLNPYLFGGETV